MAKKPDCMKYLMFSEQAGIFLGWMSSGEKAGGTWSRRPSDIEQVKHISRCPLFDSKEEAEEMVKQHLDPQTCPKYRMVQCPVEHMGVMYVHKEWVNEHTGLGGW